MVNTGSTLYLVVGMGGLRLKLFDSIHATIADSIVAAEKAALEEPGLTIAVVAVPVIHAIYPSVK